MIGEEKHLQYIIKSCEFSNIELTKTMLEQLDKYFHLLVEWNEKINLTAITQKDDVYLKHFADSIYGAKFFAKNSTVCDMGTGAGFPGVVLKIVRPDLHVVLVDALNKRINFLNEVINELQLNDIVAMHFRAEDKEFKDKYLNKFDYVTARAVARMCTLTEYCLPYVKPKGKMIAYKSDKIDEELLECKKVVKVLGGSEILTKEYNLDNETTRLIVEITKNKITDKKYPRDKNRPKTSPIL